jgi:MtrB/PioB family decaheme-associated outer membrane protein
MPLSASAEEDDEVLRQLRPDSVIVGGIGHVDSGNAKFGDYRGLGDSGAHAIVNIDYTRRLTDDAHWVEVVGRNLGLDTRSLRVEGGQQGNFKLRFEYDELPKLWTDSYQTPFVNPGSTALALPAGWVPGASTKAMPGLATSMRSYDIESTRKTLGLGLTKRLPAGWEVVFDYKRERKEGDRLIGGVIGSTGGNPRAAVLPEPIDYTTDQFEAIARYVTPKLQFQVGYYASIFRNENSALRWQNPYTNAHLTANTGYGQTGQWAQLSLPPDNQFHQINASGAWQFSKDTRLTGAFSLGRMLQDDNFLPYTSNPNILINTAMPRNSLDGRIDTTHASLKFTSKLAPKLHLNASYRYDDRDNKTARSLWHMVSGDSAVQPAFMAVDKNVRYNLPFSSTKQQVAAELDWRLAASTRLKFGYEYDWVKKTYEPIDKETEHTAKVGVTQRFGDMASGGVTYSYSDRDTSTYDASVPFRAGFPNDWTGAGLWGVDNIPTQKRFFLAPRKRDKIQAYANVSPMERLDLQFGVDYKNDDYHKSYHGLREAGGWAAHFDANLAATDDLSTHFFASWEDYGSKQRSSQFSSASFLAPDYLNPAKDYSYDIDDRTITLGLGFRLKPSERYEFGGDVSYAYSRGEIKTKTGAALPVAQQAVPLPDITSRMGRLELFGKYWLQRDLSVNVKYIYERYRSKDFALDGVLVSSANNLIGTNQLSPDYKAQLIGVTLSYNFR